jgi:DedD protein
LQVDSPAVAEVAAAPVGAPPVAQPKAEPEEVILASTPARKPAVAEAAPDVTEKKPVPAPTKVASEKAPAEKAPAEKAPAVHSAPVSTPVPAAVQRKEPDGEAARALALLEGKPAPAASPAGTDASSPRYIVQVGAFADSAVAQATREKLERTGLKTYTHVAQLPEGKRTRVRLGPFATKADAEKAAAKAKAQGLPAAILTL